MSVAIWPKKLLALSFKSIGLMYVKRLVGGVAVAYVALRRF